MYLSLDDNIAGFIPTHIKTRYECSLCNGGSYQRIENNVPTKEYVHYEIGRDDKIDRYTCDTLYEFIKDPKKLISVDSCRVLEEKCLICPGSAPDDSANNTPDDTPDVTRSENTLRAIIDDR